MQVDGFVTIACRELYILVKYSNGVAVSPSKAKRLHQHRQYEDFIIFFDIWMLKLPSWKKCCPVISNQSSYSPLSASTSHLPLRIETDCRVMLKFGMPLNYPPHLFKVRTLKKARSAWGFLASPVVARRSVIWRNVMFLIMPTDASCQGVGQCA